MSALFRITFFLGLVFLLIPLGLGVTPVTWVERFAKTPDKGLMRVMGGCGIGLIATAFVFFRGNSSGSGSGNQSDSKNNHGE